MAAEAVLPVFLFFRNCTELRETVDAVHEFFSVRKQRKR